jgi:hypothetical protein
MIIIVENRDSKAPDVQEILTKFGSIINARLGLHENGFNEGKIILDLADDEEQIQKLSKELEEIDGIRVGYINV